MRHIIKTCSTRGESAADCCKGRKFEYGRYAVEAGPDAEAG